jgi:endonuclease/exonuclease/phosphatase family metal-dependent hydrolase
VDTLHIATLNIRNIADRWDERLPLLLADMAALQPDLIGMQEVVYALQQDRILGASGVGRYESTRCWAGRPEYGNALLVKAPLTATDAERLDLDYQRSALRVIVALPGGSRLAYVVTHLHHIPAHPELRLAQTEALLAWLESTPAHDAMVVVGDFNAIPSEPTYARMEAAGFRSALLEANGAEPDVTWPSGLVAEGMDTDGEASCLDYIWLRGSIRATAAAVTFNRPAVGDPTIYPSDHFGLSAHVTVGA